MNGDASDFDMKNEMQNISEAMTMAQDLNVPSKWNPQLYESNNPKTWEKVVIVTAAFLGKDLSKIPGVRTALGYIADQLVDPVGSYTLDPKFLRKGRTENKSVEAKAANVLFRSSFDMRVTDDMLREAGLKRTGRKTFSIDPDNPINESTLKSMAESRIPNTFLLGTFQRVNTRELSVYKDTWDFGLHEKPTNGEYESGMFIRPLRAFAAGLADAPVVSGVIKRKR